MSKTVYIALLTFGVILLVGFFVYSNVRDREWNRRINQALAPTDCPKTQSASWPTHYYQGPFIDTHLHIPPLPDSPLDEEGEDDNNQPRGADADSYDTITAENRPLLGQTITIDEIACALKLEGTKQAFAFMPVYPESSKPMVEVANRIMRRYPELFFPFIQASGSEVATVEGAVLQQMLDLNPTLFEGFGETGDSPTEPINPPPDSPIYLGDFEVAKQNGLMVYFHPSEGHHQNLDSALKQFPDVTFIVHGDFVRPHIDELLASNPNLYFTANDIFEDIIPLFRFGDKEAFVSAMGKNQERLLADALRTYRPLINKYPDRFMWGTDRADIVWNYDPDVGILLASFGRAFIGQLDPAVQEDFAYRNAERLVEQARQKRNQ